MTYLSNIVRHKGDPRVLRSGPSSMSAADRMARLLGWFSIGLGLIEVLAPGRVSRALGMQGSERLVQAFGAREIGTGILSLSIDKQLGLWSRVLGDGLDLAALVPALRPDNPKRSNVGLAMAMVAGVALLDYLTAQSVTSQHRRGDGTPRDYRNRSGFPQGVQGARKIAQSYSESQTAGTAIR